MTKKKCILDLLSQVFLLGVDTSRNGCTRSSLLGNAVVISLSMWTALSGLYRYAILSLYPLYTDKSAFLNYNKLPLFDC